MEELLFTDTPLEVERKLVEGYRRMTPADKVRRVRDLNYTLRKLALAHLRSRYPTASERELQLRFAARLFDRETMIRAFGWAPEPDDD